MKQKLSYAILILQFLLLALHHAFLYIGHYGFDDIGYAELAQNLSQGEWDPFNHFSYRLVILIPTALSYSLFGLSDLSSALPSLLISASILWIVFEVLKKKGLFRLFIGLSLTTLSSWFLFYSDKLMVDHYVAFSILLALFLFYKYKYDGGQEGRNPYLYGVLFSLALFFGFNAKGTILFILPLLLLLLIQGLYRKMDLRFWGTVLGSGALLLLAYFIAIGAITGDPLTRFRMIAANEYLGPCNYAQQSWWVLFRRIGYGFLNMSVYQQLFAPFILILPFLFRKRIASCFRMKDAFSFFLVAALLLFLSSNFLSFSFESYDPMCLDPRHYLFLVPVAAIPASAILEAFVRRKEHGPGILLTAASATLLSYFLIGDSFSEFYLPLSVLFALHLMIPTGRYTPRAFALLFFSILLIKPIDDRSYVRKVAYREQRRVFEEQIMQGGPAYVLTDHVQKRIAEYFQGFEKDEEVEILSYMEFDPDSLVKDKRVILFRNAHSSYLSDLSTKDLPFYARYGHPSNDTLYRDERPDITIVELKRIILPERDGKPLLLSSNGFEEAEQPFWEQNEEDFVREPVQGGERSAKLGRFSPTFNYPTDSLSIQEEDLLIVKWDFHASFETPTAAKAAIVLEDGEQKHFSEERGIDRYLKAYSNWWRIELEFVIEGEKVKKSERLKLYIWNMDEDEGYYDEARVELLRIER